MQVLVAGGTGMLGVPVVRHLVHLGHQVRVLTRSPAEARRRLGESVQTVQGDVKDRSTLDAAVAGCDALHVTLRGADDWMDYEAVENHGLRALLDASCGAGLRHVTYLSGAGRMYGCEQIPAVAIKLAAEQAIRECGLAFTIFRATHFMESLDLFISKHTATIIGRQPHRYHYLAASDFAHLIAQSLLNQDAFGRTFYAFGPQALTMREALERYRGILDPSLRITQLPIAVARLIGTVGQNRRLRFAASLFEGFALIGEEGDPEECQRILGKPQTTLDEWLRGRASRVRAA